MARHLLSPDAPLLLHQRLLPTGFHKLTSMACTLCRSNSLGEFTIHGLWPDYNDETWPACCSRSHFEEKEVYFAGTLSVILKDFTPRDCSVGAQSVLTKLTSKSSCPKYISLPEFVSKAQEILPEDQLQQAI
ncbi:hypothetical protein MLD38_028254 [Melastoma candidum]|uniref:Uncharacterized protein n=1 Tax=Melastoma candidum TaxID=119954 RepID=A0ACB9N1C1_9MYRT|nr:hypothetical protein MLD38_028254 [Melastoma candidum]